MLNLKIYLFGGFLVLGIGWSSVVFGADVINNSSNFGGYDTSNCASTVSANIACTQTFIAPSSTPSTTIGSITFRLQAVGNGAGEEWGIFITSPTGTATTVTPILSNALAISSNTYINNLANNATTSVDINFNDFNLNGGSIYQFSIYRVSGTSSDIAIGYRGSDSSMYNLYRGVRITDSHTSGSPSPDFIFQTDSIYFTLRTEQITPDDFITLNSPVHNATTTNQFSASSTSSIYNPGSYQIRYIAHLHQDTVFHLAGGEWTVSGGFYTCVDECTINDSVQFSLGNGSYTITSYLYLNSGGLFTPISTDTASITVQGYANFSGGAPGNIDFVFLNQSSTALITTNPCTSTSTWSAVTTIVSLDCIEHSVKRIALILFQPSSAVTYGFKSSVNSFQAVFPFNIFFNFSGTLSDYYSSSTSGHRSVSLPLFVSPSSVTVLSSSSLSNVVGTSGKNSWFTLLENLIWLTTGFAILMLVF